MLTQESKLIWYGVIKGELCDLNTYIKAERGRWQQAAQIKAEETMRCAKDFSYDQEIKLEPISQFPVVLNFRWFTKNAKKDADNVTFVS